MEIGETLLVTTRHEWREWLEKHHRDYKEIWLIYYKKTSGKPGISYEESVEEALCFGWIDGAIKGIDQETYAGRFTPRRPKSPWSNSNRERVARLLREGRMTQAGLAILPDELRQVSSCCFHSLGVYVLVRVSSYSALGFWDQYLQLHYRPHVA